MALAGVEQSRAWRGDTSGVTERVRDWLVERDLDPDVVNIADALRGTGLIADAEETRALVGQLSAEMCGAGPLQPLLEQPGVTDVLVNGGHGVWVDDGRGLRRTQVSVGDEPRVRQLAQRLAALAGRRLDDACPFVDARLPGGARLHAALAPLASPGTLISLRVAGGARFTTQDLVDRGAVPAAAVPWLVALVRARLAFLVTGGTGSGKTTVLGALLEHVPGSERILIVEESSELRPGHPHVISLEGRRANAEAAGQVTLTDLVRQAMRMRPDRIVVGEVRGAEVTDLLAAMNTGHEGCCGTVHANDLKVVPARLEALALAAGLDRAAVHSQMAAGLEAVVHLSRDRDGIRRIPGIGAVGIGDDGLARVRPLLSFTQDRVVLRDPGHPVARRLVAGLPEPPGGGNSP